MRTLMNVIRAKTFVLIYLVFVFGYPGTYVKYEGYLSAMSR